MAVKKTTTRKGTKAVKKPTKAKPLTTKPNDENTRKVGKGAMNGATGRPFSKENQPSPEAKSQGKQVAKTLREFLMMPLKKGKLTKEFDKFLNECVTNYGIPKEQVNVRLFMEMRIASMAVKGDVQAYKALLDRAIGKPREEQAPIVDQPTSEEEKTKFILPGGIELEL